MENYDSIYSIALAISIKAEIEPINYDSTYSIAKAIYAKLGGTETAFDSTYSIVYAIYLLQGGVEQHFDSTYSILVAIDKLLGGTGEQKDVYSVMLDILENYSPVPVEVPYVTFKGLSDGSTVGLNKLSSGQTLEYSTDAETWVGMTTATTLDLNTDDEVYVRGILSANNTSLNYTQFKSTGSVDVSGNINNIWNYENNGSDLQLKAYCGRYLFRDCSGMTFTDITLPSENLSGYCYQHMFRGCSGMTVAPELPATTLTDYCYGYMFQGTSITTAPELPATTLTNSCYSNMFRGCTSLTTAPELPATTLTNSCYSSMFNGCTSLSSITCYAEDKTAISCTSSWVTNVSATGYFSGSTLAGWTRGASGVPVGWETNAIPQYTVTYVGNGGEGAMTDPNSPYEIGSTVTILDNSYSKEGYAFTTWNTAADGTGTDYATGSTFTITGDTILYAQWEEMPIGLPYIILKGLVDGSTVGLNKLSPYQTLEYSTDAETWVGMTTATTLTLNTNEEVYVRGVLSGHNSFDKYTQFKSTGSLRVSGNLNNIWDYENNGADLQLKVYCGGYLFKDCSGMSFKYITLPSTSLHSNCYREMFYGTSITTPPELPATTITDYCYKGMFQRCTSLTTAPVLPATTLLSLCYANMFYGCTSLTTAPVLPATTLVSGCYQDMFNGCTSLSSITCLATSGLANTNMWVRNVSSTGTFYKAANMSDWTTGDSGIPTGWTVQDYQP